MTDFLDSVTEKIGSAAQPIKPALDFVLPQQGQMQIQGIGDAFQALAMGAGDAVREGPAALLGAADQAIFGGGSARERLFLGGVALAGGAMTARGMHQAWKANQLAQGPGPGVIKTAPSGYSGMLDLGDKPRFMDLSAEAEELARLKPGSNPRTIQILASSDANGVAKGFGRWAPDDEPKNAAGAALFTAYSNLIKEGAEGAQVDIARFNTAMSKDLFKYEGNQNIRDLWRQMSEDPESLLGEAAAEQTSELFSTIKAFGDATSGIVDDDLSVGLVGSVVRVDAIDGGVQIYVKHPAGWNDGLAVDPATRNERLRQLNYRSLSDRGYRNLKRLFELGEQDMARVADGQASIFNDPLELGRDWYPTALRDVARVFGIRADEDELSRAVAAVSFLSEAEDWSTNIVKARDVLKRAGRNGDEDFQAWLRDGTRADIASPKSVREYSGADAAKHQQHFDRVWADVKAAGFKVDAPTMKKIMRLWGGVESVDDVFRSTAARKQKNFYRNIRFPDEEFPVTIDRHAFDAFLGMDAGIQDRPIDLSVLDDDQVYDVVADTYRKLAQELDVRPHQVQAVIWETWRAAKDVAGKDGWARNDPFMLELPDMDGKNPVFEALHGRGDAFPEALSTDDLVAARVLEATDVDGLTAIAQPDGTVVIAANASDEISSATPTQYPAVQGAERVPRWTPIRPRRFQDLKSYMHEVDSPTSDSTAYLSSELDAVGGHPGFREETIITFTTDQAKVKVPARYGRVTPLARGAHDAPVLSHDRLGIEDLDADSFVGPDSPMNTHAWAIISGQLNEDQIATRGIAPWNSSKKKGAAEAAFSPARATNQIIAEAKRLGYKPIRVKGKFKGVPENSVLIFGMTPEEARRLGSKFNQDSVTTNQGFLDSEALQGPALRDGNATTLNELDSELNDAGAGGLMESGGPSFDEADVAEALGSTEIVIDGKTLEWTNTTFGDYVPDVNARQLTERSRRSVNTMQLVVRDGQDVKGIADELRDVYGLDNLSVYAPQAELEGWTRAYEKYASDGSQLVVTRHSTGTPADPNGRHVFVQTAGKYPEWVGAAEGGIREIAEGAYVLGNSVRVDAVFADGVATIDGPWTAKMDGKTTHRFGYVDGSITPIFDDAEAASGRFEALFTLKGRKLEVEPADASDIQPALAAHQDMVQAGWDTKASLKVGGKEFPLVDQWRDAYSPVSITRHGTMEGRVRRTRDVPIFEQEFGIPADFSYRSGNEIISLDDEIQEAAYNLTARVMDLHGDAVHRWRLGGVVVSDVDIGAYAWMEFEAGGRIVLPASWWSNPEYMRSAVRRDRASGSLSFRLDDDPMGVLAHEYGHVLHGVLRLEERMVKNSQIDKDLIAVAKKHGKGNWSKIVDREISSTAASEPAELVAEAFSEVLWSPQPGRLSQNVYDLVQDRLGSSLKFRKAVNF